MIRLIAYAALAILTAAPWGHGGPAQSRPGKYYEIPAARGSEPTALELSEKFVGGERACVFVRGDHQPIVPLDITVFDKEGAVVASDESSKDFVAVFWVPARTAEYRIVVRNHGREFNKVYIVRK